VCKSYFNSKTTTIAIIVAALLLVLLLVWLINRRVDEPATQGNDRFGLCFISAPDHLADEARYSGALAAGARWDRWPLYWHWVDEGGYVGPHRDGSHDYDMLVAQEIAHELTPVVILLGTPAKYAGTEVEAVAETSIPSDPPPKESTLPVTASTATLPPISLDEPIFADGTDDLSPGKAINPANVWAAFVFNTVERYRPQGTLAKQQGWPREAGIRYWEVWNEPDYALFWGGTVEEYHRLLEVAYKSIKAADPEATVILGGLAFYDQRDWFPALLRQTGGDPSRAYFDVFSFHHYLSVYNSEQLISQARATLATYGLADTPIWITESGVSVWDDYPATVHNVDPDTPFRATMTEQAAYIIQNSALAFYHGVERYYHFMLHDDCGDSPSSAYGLRQNFTSEVCNPAEGKPRPAYAAYQLAAEQFQDVVPLWREKQYEQDQVAFYRPSDKSRLLALWATQGLTVTATVSATGDTAQLYWIESTESLSGTTGLSRTLTLTPTNGLYTLTLPAATNQNGAQPKTPSYQIGGQPYLMVERDTQPPRTHVQPLQPSSPPNFLIQWQGADNGSGISGYDVYVSEDNEPLKQWLADTAFNEAKYSGRVNHSYSFAIRARDQAGNEEPLPTHAQVTTQIASGPAVSGIVLGPSGEPVGNAAVSIIGPNIQESLTTSQDGLWPPLPLLPGDYEVQASAPPYGAWPAPHRVSLSDKPTTITMTLAPPTNEIASGDFEGDQVWNKWEWAGQVNLSIDAFDGQAAARLGDGAGESSSCPFRARIGQQWSLRQQVTIPPDASVLSFLYKISTLATASPEEVWLAVSLIKADQEVDLIPPGKLWQATDWTLVSKNLSDWQGQTVEVQFQVMRCSEQPFSVSLDRVSVGPGVSP